MNLLLQATSVAKKFGDHQVIKDISFTVPKGSVTVIIGPSGSGKTTLLRGLNALERPDSGVIRIGDVTVDFAQVRASKRGRLNAADRALIRRYQARSGMVFQSHNLFPHRTALQNVTEGPVVVQGKPADQATPKRGRCWSGLDWPSMSTSTPSSCPAGSSSGWASPGHWRSSRTCCSSTSRPPRSTRSSSAEC